MGGIAVSDGVLKGYNNHLLHGRYQESLYSVSASSVGVQIVPEGSQIGQKFQKEFAGLHFIARLR